MARISGINIPLNKRVEIGLTYIYGIGRSTSNELLSQVGISPDTYVRNLTDDEVGRLRDAIDSDLLVEGDLRRERSQDIKRLMEIGSYRGLRHRRGLPVRGQNTKTNARTRKGPKRMQVAGKKKAGKKGAQRTGARCRTQSGRVRTRGWMPRGMSASRTQSGRVRTRGWMPRGMSASGRLVVAIRTGGWMPRGMSASRRLDVAIRTRCWMPRGGNPACRHPGARSAAGASRRRTSRSARPISRPASTTRSSP